MKPGEVYRINGGRFEVGQDGVRTVYDDGVVAEGSFVVNQEQLHRAEQLGYGWGTTAVEQMHAEHELLHSLVAEAMGKPHSDALYGWQTKTNVVGQIPLEERIVFLCQRLLNHGRLVLEERLL